MPAKHYLILKPTEVALATVTAFMRKICFRVEQCSSKILLSTSNSAAVKFYFRRISSIFVEYVCKERSSVALPLRIWLLATTSIRVRDFRSGDKEVDKVRLQVKWRDQKTVDEYRGQL